jgi:uncharacterized protein YigA (DUF484 family)
MSGESGGGKAKARGSQAPRLEWEAVKAFLRADPSQIQGDADLLTDLGLRIHAANVVDFIPPALARRALALAPEMAARRELEAVARSNFNAQAQTHAAVVDLLEARNHADLARRMAEAARLRFNLTTGVIALERPGRTPAGWRMLDPGMADALLGPEGLCRMGAPLHAEVLFGDAAEQVASVALIRLAIWSPARQGILAFGSPDPDGFTQDMGAELTSFLARVVELTAERWPVF